MRTFYLVSYTIHQQVEVEADNEDDAISKGYAELHGDVEVLSAEVVDTYPETP